MKRRQWWRSEKYDRRAALEGEGVFTFLVCHIALLLAAALATPPGNPLCNAVALAQAGLIGVWVGAGNESLGLRIVTGLAAGAFAISAYMLRDDIHAWAFLLGVAQFTTVAACLSLQRTLIGVVVGRPLKPLAPYQGRLTIRKLMLGTVVIAGFLAALNALDDSEHSFGEGLLVLLAVFSGAGAAAIPLLGCWAVLGQQRLEWLLASALIFFLISLMVGSGMAWFAYSQTDRWDAALYTLLMAAYEAAYLAVTFTYLRARGYQLLAEEKK